MTLQRTAEVIAIGSELTSGQKLNTNSQWLSQQLTALGFEVRFHTTVADDELANLEAVRSALARVDVVITTGGLGPTLDDLTRAIFAKLADVPLELDEPSLEKIREMFARRERPCPERNRIQAMFPRGSIPIPNEHGTAPGIWLEIASKMLIALPGVPFELKPMFENWVRPKFIERFGRSKTILYRVIHTFGEGESAVEERLGDLVARGRTPEVGITASEGTISLRVQGTGATPEEAWQATQKDADTIYEKLGSLVFGEGELQLHQVVLQALLERSLTVSVAESCTGGWLGKLLTDEPGSSAVFQGGVIAYHNVIKSQLLGVPEGLLAEYGAVSRECAEAMALGCRACFQTDFAISITGIAGPGGSTPEKPLGLVFIALAHSKGVQVERFVWPMGRSHVRTRASKTALNLLRLHLLATH